MPRRATVLEDLKKEGPVVVVDGGGSLGPRTGIAPDEVDQRKIKAELIAAAWAQEGIDGVGLSASDWKLGKDEIDALIAGHEMPVLAANLVCGGAHPYPATKIVERGGFKVGIVGVTGGAPDGCEMTPPVDAVTAALAEMGPVDVTIALAPLEPDGLLAFRNARLPVDFVVDASGRQLDQPDPAGGGWNLSAGNRDRYVGVAKLTRVDGGKGWAPAGRGDVLKSDLQKLQDRIADVQKRKDEAPDETTKNRYDRQLQHYQQEVKDKQDEIAAWQSNAGPAQNKLDWSLHILSADVADEPATAKLVADAKAKIEATAPAEAVASTTGPRVGPAHSQYAGSDKCQTCHLAESQQWATTGHAKAWQALVDKGRAMDEECFSCHVTGAHTGGPETAADAGGLRDVQCEACHGPSAQHAEAPASQKPTLDPPEATCAKCHDGQRDMGQFDPRTYRPRIVHTQATVVKPATP